jgi:hypothetical protein
MGVCTPEVDVAEHVTLLVHHAADNICETSRIRPQSVMDGELAGQTSDPNLVASE